jgi:hypothetical protein
MSYSSLHAFFRMPQPVPKKAAEPAEPADPVAVAPEDPTDPVAVAPAALAAKVPVPLRANSIVHADGREYYLGDMPGSLQYSKTKEEVLSIPNIEQKDSDCGMIQIPATPDLLSRFVPDTVTGRRGDWELLVVFKGEGAGGEVWLKGAMRNKHTGLIALMTSTNSRENITKNGNRALKSLDPAWTIGWYRMGAPMCFWRSLVAALTK